MSKELNIGIGTTGLTVTCTPYLAGIAQSPINLAELGTTGVYQGDMTGSAGTYTLAFIASSVTRGSGSIIWDGAAEVTVNAANVIKLNGTAQTARDIGASVIAASVTADVGITQAAADKVWSSAVRSLTTFGSLVTDIASAVWNFVSRTLTSFGTPGSGSWVQRDSSRSWGGLASSYDGTKLIAIEYSGYIYTSTDCGATWVQRNVARGWQAVASSADGTKLVAVVYGGSIWTSTDSGVTWTERSSYGGSWWAVASSADGTKLVAVQSGGYIWTSADSGVTWTQRASSATWRDCASSSDGSKLFAVDHAGYGWTSVDSGVTWVQRTVTGNLFACASSGDGINLFAADNTGYIWTSADSGATWTARNPFKPWYCIDCSADGTKLVAVAYGDYPYLSIDSGVTWTPQLTADSWYACAISGDGLKSVAAVRGGYLWTFTSALPVDAVVWGATTRTLTAGTNIVLAKGVGLTGLNDIAATDIVSAGPIATVGGKVAEVVTVDNIPSNSDIAAIKVKTDQFRFTIANQVDSNALSGGGLDAQGVRDAIGLAAPDLDAQFTSLPTSIVSNGPIYTAKGAVRHVELVDVTTLNSDMRGTDGANTIAPDNAGIATIVTNTTDIPNAVLNEPL